MLTRSRLRRRQLLGLFWCALERNDLKVIKTVVEVLQRVYADDKQSAAVYGELNLDLPLTVVVHIRRTDGRKLPYRHFVDIMRHLCDVAADTRFVVHSDEKQAVVVDEIVRPLQKEFDGSVDVTVRDPRTTSVVQVLRELMGADVLIASKSSLSNTAGLYNLGQRPVLMPYDKQRKGIDNLPGWYVIRNAEEITNGSRKFYESVVAEARMWKDRRPRTSLSRW